MGVLVPDRSRLRSNTLVEQDGVTYWSWGPTPAIPIQADDTRHLVTSTDRIDRLARTYYRDPAMWWVIAAANNLDLHLSDLIVGETLRIPSPSYVAAHLAKLLEQQRRT
jgi:hypothetical protein